MHTDVICRLLKPHPNMLQVATVMAATARIAAATEIILQYSPGGTSVGSGH